MKNLLNFRDHLGRTPLHISAMWNNKKGCEALLFLKANPHVEDGGGYRAIDYADQGSAIAALLKNWMQRVAAPELSPFEDSMMRKRKEDEEAKALELAEKALKAKKNQKKPGF